jgi:hypothetical protein
MIVKVNIRYTIIQITIDTYYTNSITAVSIGGKLGCWKMKPIGREDTGRRAVDRVEEGVGSNNWLSARSFAVSR